MRGSTCFYITSLIYCVYAMHVLCYLAYFIFYCLVHDGFSAISILPIVNLRWRGVHPTLVFFSDKHSYFFHSFSFFSSFPSLIFTLISSAHSCCLIIPSQFLQSSVFRYTWIYFTLKALPGVGFRILLFACIILWCDCDVLSDCEAGTSVMSSSLLK